MARAVSMGSPQQYGYQYQALAYVRSSYVTAPAAGSTLTSYTLPSGARGVVLAVLLDATEGNLFTIGWTSGGTSMSYVVRLPSSGVISYEFGPGLNIDAPADPGSTITVSVNNAGSSGSNYKADLLIGLF